MKASKRRAPRKQRGGRGEDGVTQKVPVAVPARRVTLPTGHVIEMPAETIYVPADVAEEHKANITLVNMLTNKSKLNLDEFDYYATHPPMTGTRLYNLLFHVVELTGRNWRGGIWKMAQARRDTNRRNAKRKRPNRKSKWPKAVHDTAETCYREWVKAATSANEIWATTWEAFAAVCVKRIKEENKVDVPPESLRKLILPAKSFPRPRR